MSACRSCGADVIWVVTEAGRRMPLNPAPADLGNVVFVGVDAVHVLSVGEYECNVAAGERYMSHFVTCPNAKTHRRGK